MLSEFFGGRRFQHMWCLLVLSCCVASFVVVFVVFVFPVVSHVRVVMFDGFMWPLVGAFLSVFSGLSQLLQFMWSQKN